MTGSPLSSAASVPPGSQSASALPAGVLVSTATGSTSLSGLTSGLGLTSSGNSAPVVTSAGSTGSLSQAPLPNGSSSLQGLPQTSDSPSSTATSADGSNAGGPAPSDSVGGGKAGLAGGAIAGIVIGLLALFAGLAFLVWRVRKKRAKERRMRSTFRSVIYGLCTPFNGLLRLGSLLIRRSILFFFSLPSFFPFLFSTDILSQTYPFAKGFGGQGGDAKEYAGDTYTRSSPSVRSIPFAAYHPRPYSTASGESDPFGTRSIFPTQQQGHTQGLPEMRQQRNLNAIAVNANVGSFNPVPSISVDGHSSTKSASYAWHEAGGGEGDLHASTSPTRRHDGMLMTGRGLVAARDVGGEEHLQGVYVRHSNSPRTPVEEKSSTELFPQSAEIVDPFRRSLPPVKNFKLPRVQPKYNLSPTDPTPITPSSQYQTPHDEDPFGDPQHFRQQGGAQSSNDNFVSASSHDHNHDGYTSARESYRSSAGSTTYSCYDIDAVTAATPGTAGNRFVASAAANDRAGGAGEGEDAGDSMSEADSYHSASDTRPNTANEDFDTRYNKLFKAITGKGVSEGFRDSQLTVRQTQPGGGRTDSNATFSTIMYGDRGGLNDASVSSGSGSGVGSRGGAASSSSYAFSDRDDSSSSGRMSFDRYSATSGDPFALEKGLLGRTPSYASSSKMVPFPNVGLPGIAEDDLRDSVRRESQRGVYWRDGGDDDDTAKIGDYIGHPEVQGAIDFRRI